MELALSAAQAVFAALQCSQLRDLLSIWGYKSEVESLDSTVETIQAVFSHMDVMQAQGFELNAMQVDYIEKLKDAVYDADDLLDEFSTLAAQHQQQLRNCKKVRHLLSRLEKFGTAYKMSRELKNIRKKFDAIACDADKYSFKVDYQPIRQRREETCCYVYEEDIIGRDDEKKRIIDMLLESNVQGDVAVLAIVGMGGLGKTALAQLVYNDRRIQKEFPLRLWVCVSDQDQNRFNVEAVLANIYKSTNPEEDNVGGLELGLLVHKLREKLKQHKYLLVLDDVWTENHSDWLKLKGYLVGLGQIENKIVVTTRSEGTAIAVGSNNLYKLGALSDRNSWRLFERVVGKEEANRNGLGERGKNIIKKCANVPLAIRIMGSLLHGQPVNKWQTIQQSRLTEIKNDGNDIMPILKYSYHHLTPSLKSCFTYCALYPKDFTIEKVQLISLWMAHGFVEPLDEGQIIEEAAEEYFQILVRRCFFQDFVRRGNGEILRFKIHDLMHDVAQQASGKEFFVVDSATMYLDKKTRHLYHSAPCDRTERFITETTAKIRSYAKGFRDPPGKVQFPLKALLANWRSLRVLDLSRLNIIDLPNAIGGLLHLRWLNLSYNKELKMLPNSLTKLINLQFLDLSGCNMLEELPKDFNQLVNLRTLLVPRYGSRLRYMPLGMEKMACLTTLNRFVLGQRKSSTKREVRLEDLRVPRNLRGFLIIAIRPDYNKYCKEYGGRGVGYLCNTKYLESISIVFPHGEERMGNDDDDVLEDLQPYSNLKVLTITWYLGLTFPSWAREDGLATSFPNLVKIVLMRCNGLKEFPWLGRLQHLRDLELRNLKNLEHMENETRSPNIGSSSGGAASSSMAVEIFFPSLENLELFNLPKLKGWCRGSSGSGIRDAMIKGGQRLPLFPRLSKVRIRDCPNLRSMPLGPAVETLFFWDSGILEEGEDQKVVSGTRSNDFGNPWSDEPKIKEIRTNNVRFLNSLPMVAFQGLTRMTVNWNDKVESLSEVEEILRGCSSSLRSLKVEECNNLRSVSRGMEHLVALESLDLVNLPALSFDETQGEGEGEEEEEDDATGNGMPWRCLAHCLHSLTLYKLPKVVELPKGMRYLTALQSLKIKKLPLKDLPEWIACLPSLHSIEISECKHLESLPGNLNSLITSVPIFSEEKFILNYLQSSPCPPFSSTSQRLVV